MLSKVEKIFGTLKQIILNSMLFAFAISLMKVLFEYHLFSYAFYELLAALSFGILTALLMKPWQYYGDVTIGIKRQEI